MGTIPSSSTQPKTHICDADSVGNTHRHMSGPESFHTMWCYQSKDSWPDSFGTFQPKGNTFESFMKWIPFHFTLCNEPLIEYFLWKSGFRKWSCIRIWWKQSNKLGHASKRNTHRDKYIIYHNKWHKRVIPEYVKKSIRIMQFENVPKSVWMVCLWLISHFHRLVP